MFFKLVLQIDVFTTLCEIGLKISATETQIMICQHLLLGAIRQQQATESLFVFSKSISNFNSQYYPVPWNTLYRADSRFAPSSGQTILLNDRSDRSKPLRSIIDRKANLRSIICRFFIIVKWMGLLLWKQYIIITVKLGIWDNSHSL